MKLLPTVIGLVVAVVWVLAPPAMISGKVFVLRNGGQVEGELVNRDRSPDEPYVIETVNGGRITLARSQVKKVLARQPAEVEYEKIRPRYDDTIDGQWALAEWCRENHLNVRRKIHLRRILEIDPDHKKVRAALGYHQSGGKWVTQEEVMTKRGYRRYKGRWRSPQEIELLEKRREQESTEKAWFGKVHRWRGWLGGDRTELAQQNLAAIDDPSAVRALAAALENDPRRQAQLLYIAALGRIGTAEAVQVLAVRALEDPDEEVRLSCLDQLKKEKHPEAVGYFIGKLKHKDNRAVNLAGVALGQMKDPAAVGPLIDAIITVHKYKITKGKPGSTSATFGNTGPSGLSVGSSTKTVRVPIKNQAVLDALVVITGGVNFSFDTEAWRCWFASRNDRSRLDARRD